MCWVLVVGEQEFSRIIHSAFVPANDYIACEGSRSFRLLFLVA